MEKPPKFMPDKEFSKVGGSLWLYIIMQLTLSFLFSFVAMPLIMYSLYYDYSAINACIAMLISFISGIILLWFMSNSFKRSIQDLKFTFKPKETIDTVAMMYFLNYAIGIIGVLSSKFGLPDTSPDFSLNGSVLFNTFTFISVVILAPIFEELIFRGMILNALTKYNKILIKSKIDVSDLKNHCLSNQLVHRTYFQVSIGNINTIEEQFDFIEDNEDLLQDWWHVDQLTQFIKKPVDYQFALSKAKLYIESDKPFVRRWGYVLFLVGLQKNKTNTKEILLLMKDDEEYYVQMAQAWLIADLAVYNIETIKEFIYNTKLKYNIIGKAIQKICDSFRISYEDKEYLKKLRNKVKNN